MNRIATILLFALAVPVLGQSPWLPDAEQIELRKLWPKTLEMPEGLRFYRPATYTQRLVISNEKDSNLAFHVNQDNKWVNASPKQNTNPNRIFPWRVSGGLHESTGWESRLAVLLPGKIQGRWEKVEAGAGRPLPQARWRFLDGTIFVDMLAANGKTFEVRLREKHNGAWSSRTVYKTETLPENYIGPRKGCVACHAKAGGSEGYGVRLRGSDENFSFPVIAEQGGNTRFNRTLVEQGILEVK